MGRFSTFTILILLMLSACTKPDDAACEMDCGENIMAGDFDLDVNSNFAFVFPGGEEIIYKNETGDTLTFSNAGLEEQDTQISFLNCVNTCSNSSTTYDSNVKVLTRRSGEMTLTIALRVGILGQVIGEEPLFYDYADIFSDQTPMRILLLNRGNTEVDPTKVNILSSFNQQLLLGDRTFNDVYSLIQDEGEIHYNFFQGIVAFRNNISGPLWVFERAE